MSAMKGSVENAGRRVNIFEDLRVSRMSFISDPNPNYIRNSLRDIDVPAILFQLPPQAD